MISIINKQKKKKGTNACNNGVFWCKNAEWVGNSIQSSHVNDGICDCCDGSDEWQQKVVCQNTCLETKERVLKERKEKAEKGRRGLIKKDLYIESAKIAMQQKRSELDEINQQKASIEQTIAQKEIKKNEMQEKESIANEIKNLVQRDLNQQVPNAEENQANQENQENKPINQENQENKDNQDDGGPDFVDTPALSEEERSQKIKELKNNLGRDDYEAFLQGISSSSVPNKKFFSPFFHFLFFFYFFSVICFLVFWVKQYSSRIIKQRIL